MGGDGFIILKGGPHKTYLRLFRVLVYGGFIMTTLYTVVGTCVGKDTDNIVVGKYHIV